MHFKISKPARYIELEFSEARIQFDETDQPVSVIEHHQEEAHQLIEEFMIAANICALKHWNRPERAVSIEYMISLTQKIVSLHELTDALSLPFAKGQVMTPHRFNELLMKVKDTDLETAVNEAVLRCQSRAVYSPDNIGHYGLGLTRYAHLPSIRRYADLWFIAA